MALGLADGPTGKAYMKLLPLDEIKTPLEYTLRHEVSPPFRLPIPQKLEGYPPVLPSIVLLAAPHKPSSLLKPEFDAEEVANLDVMEPAPLLKRQMMPK